MAGKLNKSKFTLANKDYALKISFHVLLHVEA